VSDPKITMVVPFYRQSQMLRKQLETWASYHIDALCAFEFIVVDDGSPEPAEPILREAYAAHGNLMPAPRLLRIEKDVPWNRGMARNLGTLHAETEWVLHVDTDHVLPPDSALTLVRLFAQVSPAHWYRFKRFRVGAADETRKKDAINPHVTFGEIKPHIDSYLCTKKAYWKAGGYNEDFSGVLGGGSPFLKEMEKANGEPRHIEAPLHVHTRDSVPDSSENTLSRDPALFAARKREIMAKRGTLRGHNPVRLPWHEIDYTPELM
jgi:glycosyltransferase involved in cell wall biosynthesis